MKWIILFIAAVIMYGCNTEKRALSKTQLYLFKHPEFSAGYCAEQFPVRDSIKTDTVTTTDTLYVEGASDTVMIQDFDTVRVFITKTLTGKTITNTIHIRDTIIRENQAEQSRLQLALLSCNDNTTKIIDKNTKLELALNDWKKKAKTRWLWIALLIGGAVGYTAFKLFKTFKSPVA